MDAFALLLLISVIGYFLPWMIALGRRHHQTVSIFMLNLLLGWTFVGWVAALVWSFSHLPEKGVER